MMQGISHKAPVKWRKIVIGTVLGGVAGFGAMWLVDMLLGGRGFEAMGGSQVVSLGIGVVYVLMGALVAFGVASPNAGSRVLNVEDAEELREQRTVLALSAVGSIAIGAMMVLLALAEPSGTVPAPVVLASSLFAVLVAGFASLRQWRLMDELMRRVTQEATVTTYYLIALLGGGWALVAHLGYAAAPLALDWISMLAGGLLLASFIAAGRRGMLAPR